MQVTSFLMSVVRFSLKVGFLQKDLSSILQPNASNQKYLNFAEHSYYQHQKNTKYDTLHTFFSNALCNRNGYVFKIQWKCIPFSRQPTVERKCALKDTSKT